MTQPDKAAGTGRRLADAARAAPDKILNPAALAGAAIGSEAPVLVLLAAGKGTRFGRDPKCIQPVNGTPLARHSIDAFRHVSPAPAVVVVGYRHEEVAAALGSDNVYVRSDNPAGGTAFAVFEAFSVAPLLECNPLLIVSMGDRIVPPCVYRRLWECHRAGPREADLSFLSAVYEPPRNRGKGRVLRAPDGRVLRIAEERDLQAEPDPARRAARLALTEGNCPLYAARAATLWGCLQELTDANAQAQFYLTDVLEALSRRGADIRTITTTVADPEYDLLCSDVTQPADLALLEGTLASARGLLFPDDVEVDEAARTLAAGRPPGQVASIARQLGDLVAAAAREGLGFAPDRPVAVGVSGGRLRIASMHPDMGRFFGPAWQMPIGAGDRAGEEQIVVLVQAADDSRIHLYPTNPEYRESVNSMPADDPVMYPGEDVSDLHAYEGFGTRMSEALLLALGYFSDEELARRRERGQPSPPPQLWVANSLRRPFPLVCNAIASLRTLRRGSLGARVQAALGRERFRGLRLVSTGAIPQGGFSSSSAVTVATKNAVNALYALDVPPDLLVHLACQAEYGTGVRAGSLDQATEQKGRAGEGTLISSNPRDNYRILGTYPMPSERIRIVFPYSVERDRAAWRWSWGVYAELARAGGPLTAGEMRKLTGKAAELAALLTRLPLEDAFFRRLEPDLLAGGALRRETRAGIAAVLRSLPLLTRKTELRERVEANRAWYEEQLTQAGGLDEAAARLKAGEAFDALFAGWRDPVLRRTTQAGVVVREEGVPLRAMVAYLFAEMAKVFHLIHHPDEWVEWVARSQRGDRCVDLDPERLPPRAALEGELEWERGVTGPDRLNVWLERHGATPFDYNRGLDDTALDAAEPPDFRLLEGANFFRGLALLDLAEGLLHRAFGREAVAVRVNAAGQGDYFQVHVDRQRADPEDVKRFLRAAFYRRFGLTPQPEFVEVHTGGGAAGIRLSRYDALAALVRRLESENHGLHGLHG
jgi:hypothetical protein